MKAKKISKKFLLIKQTISHLNGNQMKNIYGGESTPMSLCHTYCWPANCISNTICQEECPGA